MNIGLLPVVGSSDASSGDRSRSGGGWGEFIQSIIGGWSETGQKVVLAQNVPRGVYRQVTPQGETVYVQPEHSQQPVFTRTEVGGTIGARGEVAGFGTLFIVGGVIFGAMMLMALMRSRK